MSWVILGRDLAFPAAIDAHSGRFVIYNAVDFWSSEERSRQVMLTGTQALTNGCDVWYSECARITGTVFAARCYASAAYVVMRCLSVCPSVTFVSCVKTNKRIVKIFSPSGSHAVLVFFHAKRHSNIPTGTSLTGASNAGVVGRNRDSEPICLLLTLQHARCCKHGRRWTTATISQVVSSDN